MPRIGLTRDRVTLAAAELADEHGLDQVTLTSLAARFGVKVPSLYTHVRSADDVKTAVALLALEELADRAAEALAGRSGRDAIDALGTVFRRYAVTHPGRYAATRLPLDAETARASAGPRHAELTRAVLRGYRLDEVDSTHGVRLLGATFHGYAALESAGAFGHSDPDPDTTWQRVVDGLHTMFTTWEKKT